MCYVTGRLDFCSTCGAECGVAALVGVTALIGIAA